MCKGIHFWWKFKYKIRLFTTNCITPTEILFSFIPQVSYSLCHPWIAASEDGSFATLFSTQIRDGRGGGDTATRSSTCLTHSVSSVTPPLPSVKSIKNLRSIRKFKYARHLYIDRGLCTFYIQIFKTVSNSFNNSELVRTLHLMALLSNL